LYLRSHTDWYRRLRWAFGVNAPFRRRELHLARGGALGDVLLCMPAARAIKALNPSCLVYFYTKYTELLRGLSFLDGVRPIDEAPPHAIELEYESCIPPFRHIARIFGDQVGVAVKDVRPSCALDETRGRSWRSRFAAAGRPVAVVNRRAGPWTPNKDWPEAYWAELLERLRRHAMVVEIGAPGAPAMQADDSSYIDLRGQTDLADLVAVIAAANIHIGPISGPVHVAAAFRVPSVVIYGGYEDPVCSEYQGNVNLVNQPDCSPCWLREPCPIGLICLQNISVATVFEAAVSLLSV
jgi:ADP-heptose:LPS heptosyltransferase